MRESFRVAKNTVVVVATLAGLAALVVVAIGLVVLWILSARTEPAPFIRTLQ